MPPGPQENCSCAQDVELGQVPAAVLGRQGEAVQVVLLGQLVELLRERRS